MLEQLSPELEAEVERRANEKVKQQAAALELTGIKGTLDKIVKEQRAVRLWMRRADRKLEDSNHLRETMATREDLTRALSNVVVVQDLGQGEYSVRLGDVVLGPDDVDELPLALRASRSARASAAQAKQSAADAAAASTLRSFWVGSIAAVVGTAIPGLTMIGGFVWFLHLKGLL